MRRLDCHDRLKDVLRRYEAALRTVDAFLGLVESDPSLGYENDLTVADLKSLAYELHDVYFARMFACFESSVRHYWKSMRSTKPLTEVLLNAVASRCGIPQDALDVVHEIRVFRNALIHEDHTVMKRFGIGDGCKHLNTFLARLPHEWQLPQD